TKVNVDHLDKLAAHVAGLNVPRLKLSAFSTPYPRRLPAEKLVTDRFLQTELEKLRQNFQDRAFEIVLGGSGEPTNSFKCCTSTVCQIGTSALDVLPDGAVSRCHYLPGVSEMRVGSLRAQSILEVWNSMTLKAMVRPDREAYAGTACTSCDGHSRC